MSQKYIFTENKNMIKYSYFEETLKSLKNHKQFPLLEKPIGYYFKFNGNVIPLKWEHIKNIRLIISIGLMYEKNLSTN